MGCTSVRYADAAHDRGSMEKESLVLAGSFSCLVVIAAEDWNETLFDAPIHGDLNLHAAHHGEYVDDRLIPLHLRVAEIDFAAAHDRCEVATAKLLGRTLSVEATQDCCRLNEIARIDRLIHPKFFTPRAKAPRPRSSHQHGDSDPHQDCGPDHPSKADVPIIQPGDEEQRS